MTIIPIRRSMLWALLIPCLSVLSAFGSGYARHESGGPPPLIVARTVSGDAGRGRKLFVQSCAHCHGDDATGSGEDGDGPNLHRLAIGNARISAVIRTGIPEEMPSFAKKHHAADIVDITSYLRTLH